MTFENNPHSHWFSGSISCEYIDRLAAEWDDVDAAGGEHNPLNSIPIISRSRDGLEHEHPFYKAFVSALEPLLAGLVREEERRAKESEVVESAHMRRALDSLGRDLGQLVDADLREIDEDGLDGGRRGEASKPLRIIPENLVLYMGEDKTISVVALRSLGATNLEVEVDPEGVIELLDSLPIPLEDHPRREDCQIARVHLRPLIEEEETLLTIRCGDAEAVASVEVRAEREFPAPMPPTQFEFARPRYQIAQGRRRSLVLRAPVEVINDAPTTMARVISSDAGVVVYGGQVKLEFDEDELCFIGRVPVEGRILGSTGTLTAVLGEARAECYIVVGQRDSGGPRLDIKLVDEAQGRFRAYVEREGEVTTISVLGRHAAIKRYLGPGPDFPSQDTTAARLMIAEIVAGEAARIVMERKYRTVGELDGAGFYSEHLLYMEKYLPRCHRMMLADTGGSLS